MPASPRSPSPGDRAVVVGVTDHQPAAVLDTAADFAVRLGGPLILVAADPTHLPADPRTAADPDAPVVALDPDEQDDDARPRLRAALEERVAALRADRDLDPSIRLLPGDPADALAAVAQAVGAQLIVVGTADRSFRAGVREFFEGSVATHLAHRQPVPVLVVPSPDVPTARTRGRA
ncbi:universal stress protein [Tersicoccus sp. MR15.9]|uniref:universal stress protein n=1 Tax=Tersicoccus mangrovi TaxID=3121635 RepID=UPI002FE56383